MSITETKTTLNHRYLMNQTKSKLVDRIMCMIEQEERYDLFLKALLRKVARWEPFSGQEIEGEICVGGLRYSAKIDKDTNMPIIDNHLYSILKANMTRVK